MEDQKRIETLLEEIRDAQSESLTEYKRVTSESPELQKRAVARQEQMSRTYRVALIITAVVIASIIGLVIYWLQFMPMYL